MSKHLLIPRLGAGALLFATSVGCDYTGDWLFATTVEGVPGVMHIYAEDGSEVLTPLEATSSDEILAGIILGEVGPTGSAVQGGTTFNFLGTGGPVCVFVDPETAFWNWSVAPNPDVVQQSWAYPDNVYDDGDIDLYVGLSAYYTGSPGVEIGDFIVSYTDSLGQEIPIELSVCTNIGLNGQVNAHAGRGTPEFCDIAFTDLNVSYTGLLQTFSTPLDDGRLGFGLIVYDGTCPSLIQQMTGLSPTSQGDAPHALECVIAGESVIPRPVPENALSYCTGSGCLDPWPGVAEFESEFCLGAGADMRKFCRKEASEKFESGIDCQLTTVEDIDARCFCGDVNDLPAPGAL